jgi:nucleotide-binding universal stress UspA family protein
VTQILCATRGGEASYRTQDAAITLAKERGADLLFLYVANIDFLDRTARAVRPHVVEAEMEKLGQFLLTLAQERARRQGVDASTILRRGSLREELKAVAREKQVELVVLGAPAAEGSHYSLDDLEAFAEEIESDTGTPVSIL